MCALLALLTGLLYARFAARASYGLGARIREAEYAKVQQYAFSNLDHFETSSLVTRLTTDVTVLQNAINSGFRPVVRGPVMLVLGVGLSFWMTPGCRWCFLCASPFWPWRCFLSCARWRPCTPACRRSGPCERRSARGACCHPRGKGICARGI